MQHIVLFLTLFSSAAVMPMEQIHYGIEPLSICGAAVLPGASYVRSYLMGNAAKPQKSGPIYRAFSSYGRGLATKQSNLVLANVVLGFVGGARWLRPISYVPSPIDILVELIKDSSYFENAATTLVENPRYVPIVKFALGAGFGFSVNRILLPKIVEYMPTVGELLERWQQMHAPYSPNILDKSWAKVIVCVYGCYSIVLAADYYSRSKRPSASS